ncbi:hypothetical protein ASB57_28960 [Bordetella sp. N]|nr:hypothetical protein ASB57_28960 [Bordetella sp. N]
MPHIAAASVGAFNALARHGEQLEWPGLNGQDGRWRLSLDLAGQRGQAPAPMPTQYTDTDVQVALRLSAAAAMVRVVIPHAALAAWLAAYFPGLGRVDPCAWVMDAGIECLLDVLRPCLRSPGLSGGWRLSRDEVDADAVIDAAWHGTVVLTAPDGGETWTLPLQADAGGLALLSRCLPRQSCTGPDVWLDDVPIPMRAMVGYTDLTQEGVRRLACGDVVLLDQTFGRSRGEVCLRAPNGRALKLWASKDAPEIHDEAGGDRSAEQSGMPAPYLIIADWISIMSPEEKEHYPVDDGTRDLDMPPADDGRGDDDSSDADEYLDDDVDDGDDGGPRDLHEGSGSDAAGVDTFDDIPVRLGFDLGARTMPLGEVRRLRPGQTLVLYCESATAPVSIRANGQCIGHGELVEIDGRLGVRIVNLRRAPP